MASQKLRETVQFEFAKAMWPEEKILLDPSIPRPDTIVERIGRLLKDPNYRPPKPAVTPGIGVRLAANPGTNY